MSYCVNVPLGQLLKFPKACPFSGRPDPTGVVRLKRTSTSLVLPLPGGFANSYSQTAFRLPACRRVAACAMALEILMWISLLGGVAICCWLVSQPSTGPRSAPAAFLLGGPLVALGFRFARFLVLRGVRVGNAWNGFVEVSFKSEAYAREFSELNRLGMIPV